MFRIIHAAKGLWLIIFMLFTVSFYQGYRLSKGLYTRDCNFHRLFEKMKILRLLQMTFGIGIIAFWIWSQFQSYLFFTSVFPIAAGWAEVSFVFMALILITSAMFQAEKI